MTTTLRAYDNVARKRTGSYNQGGCPIKSLSFTNIFARLRAGFAQKRLIVEIFPTLKSYRPKPPSSYAYGLAQKKVT